MGWQDWFKGGSGQKETSADTRADRDPSWNRNGTNAGDTVGTGGFLGGVGVTAGLGGSSWGPGNDSAGSTDRIAQSETGRDDRWGWGAGGSRDGWGYGGGTGGSSGSGDTWGTPGRDPWSNPSRDPYGRD